MKRYKFIMILLLSILTVAITPIVFGDMGPKPTTDVEIIGLDEPYYFDLLEYKDEEDVTVLDEDSIFDQIDSQYYLDTYPDVLNGYRDEDGFASYTLYTGEPHYISKNANVYHCGYFSPPDIFKVVIVLASGDMIVSDIIEKQLFAAHVTFDLTDFSETNTPSVAYGDIQIYYPDSSIQEDIPVKEVIIQIVITLALTLVVEGLILLAFGYREKKSFLLVLYVNLITQLLLYLAIDWGYFYGSIFGFIGMLLLGEIIVFIVEIVVYALRLKEKTKSRAVIYAIVANLISLFIGLFGTTFILSLFI